MDIVEGRVVFRNRMGRTTLVKVETADTSVVTVRFREESIGDAYERVRELPLFDRIRVEVGPEATTPRGRGFREVTRFADHEN
jgi:hypothetical protein